MRILLDTNIIMTFLTGRDDKYTRESKNIMNQCMKNQVEGFVAFHSLSILWYLLRTFPLDNRFQWLKLVCTSLTVAHADNTMLLNAIAKKTFTDFEDNLQDCCAQNINADYIISANVKDFKNRSIIPAITPVDFISISEKSNKKDISSSFEVRENTNAHPYMKGPTYKIYVQEDLDNKFWIAFSSDVPGLFIDDQSYDSLISRVLQITPWLLKKNNIPLKDYYLNFCQLAAYKLHA